MIVKLSDIVEAIEMTDQYTHNFLDKVTGKIVWINEMAMTTEEQEEAYEGLDEHGFYRLPTSYDLRDYDTMEEFVETQPSPAKDRLRVAIEGRGAFRRFKDEVRRLGIEQQWYDWRDGANRRKAIRWCEENGISWKE